jgi:hypothetical protein
LKIEGAVGDSARRVKEIRVEHYAEEINILVVLTRSEGTGTGSFVLNDLLVDPGISKITFGYSRRMIWERRTSVEPE